MSPRTMENYAFEIVETARAIRREANKRAAVLGATKAQWRVLAWLKRKGDGARQIRRENLCLTVRLDLELHVGQHALQFVDTIASRQEHGLLHIQRQLLQPAFDGVPLTT